MKTLKVYHIQTWGGGTPHFIVAAETKERAWELVVKEWRRIVGTPYVGQGNYDNLKQTIDSLRWLPGLTCDKEVIYDLNKSR